MMARDGLPSGWFGGPLWVSGFRPFFLLGTAYGLIALGAALPPLLGRAEVVRFGTAAALWHGHEMVFGFAAAIVSGLLLTALPSWAGMPEVVGRRLAILVGAWLGGRLAFWLAPFLSPAVVACVDVAGLVLLTAMLTRGLSAVSDRRFLAVLPVLAALAFANIAFHWALAAGNAAEAARSLDAAVAIIAVLFSLVGGFLTPVFTRNAMETLGTLAPLRKWRSVEAAAHASVAAFAIGVALAAPDLILAAIAAVAAVAHAVRLAGWRGLAVRQYGLAFAMHLAYAWLVVAFALAAVSSLGAGIAPRTWVHAVTIGAVGTMMLALMPRVSLRHTGRPLALAPAIFTACLAMQVAAVLRLGVATAGWGVAAIGAAALLWGLGFAAYLATCGPMLLRPSLPREKRG